MKRLSTFYSRFRSGWLFLAILAGTIVFWLAAHWIWGIDPELTQLNLVLSIEASLSVGVLIAAQEQNDSMTRAILTQILADAERINRDMAEHQK